MPNPKEWWIDPEYEGYFDDTDDNLIASGFVKAVPLADYEAIKQERDSLLANKKTMTETHLQLHAIYQSLREEIQQLRKEHREEIANLVKSYEND
jgi:hypothetical protein